MALKITSLGRAEGLSERAVLRVTRTPLSDVASRRDHVLVIEQGVPDHGLDLSGYGAILVKDGPGAPVAAGHALPVIRLPDVAHLEAGHIVAVSPRSGFVRTVFRPESPHNTLFATGRCNSNCLMCSQPPKDEDDSYLVAENLRIIELIDRPPEALGITGGEPTLLGDGLVGVLSVLREKLPQTYVHMLTNGRRYRDSGFVRKLANVGHPAFVSGIPLYADVATVHDYIVQAEGAFDETVEGLYNAAEAGLAVEIRVVLHKQSVPRLVPLVEYIYRNFPFVTHVALMGLEHMGYVKKNWDTLWVDPVAYVAELTAAVRYLHQRRVNVSIYNLQLCLLPQELWGLAKKSISDFKNVYLPECEQCAVRSHCCGLFLSQMNRHSAHIRAM